MSSGLLSLLRWVGGSDHGKYTVGLPVSWIKNFDYNQWEQGSDDDETYVIQWRNTMKEPPGGWKCFDAIVVDISSKLNTLERKFRMLQGVKSLKQYDKLQSSSLKGPSSSVNVHLIL